MTYFRKYQQRDSSQTRREYTVRLGYLCCMLLFYLSLSAFHEGNIINFALKDGYPRGSKTVALGVTGPYREAFWCDRSHRSTDVCLLRGDVHLRTGNLSSLTLYSKLEGNSLLGNCFEGDFQIIRPYTRKWETQLMESVKPVSLKCEAIREKHVSRPLLPSGKSISAYDSCEQKNTHATPAVLFSIGGFTGNPYHDFQDVLIPLYIVSQHLKGEVVFIMSDMRPWWVRRWKNVLDQMTHHPILDVREPSAGEFCFPEVLVGLYTHSVLGLTSALMPHGETIEDFHCLLHEALAPQHLKGKFPWPIVSAITNSTAQQSRLPKLLILARNKSRVLINLEDLKGVAEELRFKVSVVTLSDQIDLQTIYEWVYSSDVVMGVHGAELAHMIFMRNRAVLMQIVPLGTDWPASEYYKGPAIRELGLQYLEYKIRPEESSLSAQYGLWHPVVQNPALYVSKGWETLRDIYLNAQNVYPSPDRLRNVLVSARSMAVSLTPLA